MSAAPPAAPAATRPSEATKSWTQGLGQVSVDGGKTMIGTAAPPPAAGEDEGPGEGEGEGNTPPGLVNPLTAQKPDDKEKAPDAQQPDTDKWPRSAQQWKKFREERDKAFSERDTKIKALEEELGALRTKASNATSSAELEEIRKERDALSERLRIVSVERHPKFEAYFKNKTQAQMEMAKRIVGKERAEEVEKILSLTDGEARTTKLMELLGDLSSIQQVQFGGVLNNLEAIQMERENEIANASKTYQEMVESERKVGEERRKGLEATFEAALQKATGKDGVPMFQQREGDDAWNKDVNNRIAAARSILFSDQPPEKLVQAALNAMAYQPLIKALEFSVNEAAKLKQQIAALTKASPGMGDAKGGEAAAGSMNFGGNIPAGARPSEVSTAFMKGLPAVR